MAALALRNEERIGLGLALAAHVGLVALIVTRPAPKPLSPPVERMTVTISDEVGLTSTSPEPAAQAAPDEAPELGEPAPPEPVPQPIVRPEPPKPMPKAIPSPRPAPRPITRPPPPRPQPVVRAAPPRSQPSARPVARPQTAGATRIGSDFLKGVPGAQKSGASQNQAAANAGPQVRASFAQAVLRQVKPNWQGRVPQGLNTDKIVTILAVELNRDGSLARAPTLVRQTGIDDTNRAQAQRHLEEAIKAVQLSQPFRLPPDMFEAWRRLPPLAFKK